ncbi:MAG TPA: Glu-tRNA(Gln) amidotransferase subunit GatE, partial [archaeon]|nr:Glu-tRNA(Gln) amidotransferase subunit GatE [archaeon]
MNYSEIGFKSGLEIHQQLDTEKKLFCNCKSRLTNQKAVAKIMRKQRPVAGELGEVDAAAAYELLKNKTFEYDFYPQESCLVEADEEPPHPINPEALKIGLQVALLLNCEIPDEIHVMRKTVIDGSNTSGFQRTSIIGLNGWIETSKGKVGITSLSLEEDSAQILDRKENKVVYGLDRLGIPLLEIGTAAEGKDPEHAKELAEKLGLLLKSVKVKKGLGTIRQDLNVSIKGGARQELKGFQ